MKWICYATGSVSPWKLQLFPTDSVKLGLFSATQGKADKRHITPKWSKIDPALSSDPGVLDSFCTARRGAYTDGGA